MQISLKEATRIDPSNYIVDEVEIRRRLNLTQEDVVIPYGYEFNFPIEVRRQIQNSYDLPTLFLRLRPDWYIQKDHKGFFVEAKKDKPKYLEAVQLFFNRQLIKLGISVYYSFPNILVAATEIPFVKVVIPKQYRSPFDVWLKPEFEKEYPDMQYEYCGIVRGSGDPFIVFNGDKF